ncbi:carbon-nitrogen hydrolase [Viridothelium virens]|uniref:Carbon-nitrogen hydrolase n=1 Tax=Viridothelium virens TaxID=1048519 RepID=A0A6A6HL57_VIRVR|nr:carbon-nitrogen hydrolase [Viridothelium virens]
MKIACLQFAPEVGKVQENIAKANHILERDNVSGVDILVLPEMAFSGYNFLSPEAITPFLEPTKSGTSTQWAIKTATRLNCIVMVGYPEVDISETKMASTFSSLPNSSVRLTTPQEAPADTSPSAELDTSSPRRYNSLVTVSPTGAILAHYRKSFLFYTDETWASENPLGFLTSALCPLPTPPSLAASTTSPSSFSSSSSNDYLARVTQGICMDINPYRFLAPPDAFEFANHVLATSSRLAIISMAWLVLSSPEEWIEETREHAEELEISTLTYWVGRLRPLVENEGGKIVVVCANRTGIEGEACYAGSSTVMKLGGGNVEIMGYLGRGAESVLVVDLEEEPKYQLRIGPAEEMGEGDRQGD